MSWRPAYARRYRAWRRCPSTPVRWSSRRSSISTSTTPRRSSCSRSPRPRGVSRDYLGRIFHQELGLSPWDYLLRCRIRRQELLRETSLSITEIATQVGFDDPSYFGRLFRKEVGRSPRQYRESAGG